MTEHTTSGSGPAIAEIITVALIFQAAEDLRRSMDRENLSCTDITNRAIALYEFASASLAAGGKLLLCDAAGNVRLVKVEGTGKVAVTAEESAGGPEDTRPGDAEAARDA